MQRKLIFIFFTAVLLLQALNSKAQSRVVEGKLADDPQRGICLTETMREQIKQQLRLNIRDLQARGILRQKPLTLSDPTVRFIWPIRQSVLYDQKQVAIALNYVDHDPSNNVLDYNGGRRTYNGHQGTDIALRGFAWNMKRKDQVEVIAPAAGTILLKFGTTTNDSNCVANIANMWNAIYLAHDDGSITWLGHMKYGSLTSKAEGSVVAQGEYLGTVASSGYSNGPHLHFEVYKDTGMTILLDPWLGSSNPTVSVSLWQSQRPYDEKEVFIASTHEHVPELGCNMEEKPWFKKVFCEADSIYFYTFVRDITSTDVLNFMVKDASGGVVYNKDITGANFHQIYHLESWKIPVTQNPGKWNLTVSFGGKSAEQSFIVEQGGSNAGIELFNMCNTPAFATNIFSSIAVGKHGVVWAGTTNFGLYRYKENNWEKFGAYSNNSYQDIKADQQGRILIAQSGNTGAQAITGGVLYFSDTSFSSYTYYGALAGLPSRNARGIFVDTARYNAAPSIPLVWVACYSDITGGVSGTGGVGRGLNANSPKFNDINYGVDSIQGTGGVFYVGGNSSEIWSFANNNYGKSQILRHHAVSNAPLGPYDTTNVFKGILPGHFAAKSIYFDAKGRRWITINNVGIVVQQNGKWIKLTFPELLGSSPSFNNNSITGDTSGNVYIGTTSGLIIYRNGNPLSELSSYKKYTVAEGLPSSNIRAICIDTLRRKILVATDNGIAFWNPVCAQNINALQTVFSTSAAGNWSVPASWCNNVVPSINQEVIIRHAITITTNTTIKSVKIIVPGSITVSPGIELKVTN